MNKKQPIQTKFPCKNCGATIDCSLLKETIKRRIMEKHNLELDAILDEL